MKLQPNGGGGTALKGFPEEEIATYHFHCYLNSKWFTFKFHPHLTHCYLLENWGSNLILFIVFEMGLYTHQYSAKGS